MFKKQIVVSLGELAGISPNIVLLKSQVSHPQFIVFADADEIVARAKLLGLRINITDNPTTNPYELCVHHIAATKKIIAGNADYRNALYTLNCLTKATKYCLKNKLPLLTLPISKQTINRAGIHFSGHTEYLAQITNTDRVVMLLKCSALSVALATTHIPLKDVAKTITKELLTTTINIVNKTLGSPKIIILGLNPHAGEGGFLGDEEIKIINPVAAKMQKRGINITKAMPADTVFSQQNMQQNTVFLAMYHDQGLSVLKTLCKNKAVNVSLGLPITRVSVDHGTALSLATSNKINLSSFDAAIDEIMG